MRFLVPIVALLICTGCHVRAPVPAGVRAAGHADLRVDVRLRVRAKPRYQPPPPPPVRPEPVPLEGAGVVEFFGVPLEGTQDVVFLLDRSGSMTDPAPGALALLSSPPPAPTQPDPASPEGMPPAAAPEANAPAEPYDPPSHASADPASAPAEPYDAPPSHAPADRAPAPAEPYDPPSHASAEPASHTGESMPRDPAMDPPTDGPDEPDVTPDDPATEPPTDAPDDTAVAPEVPRKIDVARRELNEALAQLPAGTRLNVLFFNDWLETYAPGLFPMEEPRRDDLIRFVDGTEVRGATALATAMRAALLMGARHVVLLSDGRGNVGGGSEEILRDAREAMRAGVRIDTIGIGADQDRPLLRALADESGGLYQAF
jgi:hypothetical protein